MINLKEYIKENTSVKLVADDMSIELYKIVQKTDWGSRTMFSNADSTIRFATYTYDDDRSTLYFSNLFVDDKYKRRGYGQQILDWVLDYAKSNSYDAVILNVDKSSWVKDWYERNGFKYLEDADGDYKGNIWMRKEL